MVNKRRFMKLGMTEFEDEFSDEMAEDMIVSNHFLHLFLDVILRC